MPKEYKALKIVIDLDATVLGYDGFRGANIFGGPVPGVECFLSVAHALGHRMLLWTTRPRGKVRPYLKLVKDNGLRGWSLLKYFDDVNQFPVGWQPRGGPTGPKPYYDFSLDDKTFNGHLMITNRMPAPFTPLSWGLITVRLLQHVKSMEWRGHQEANWLQHINHALTRLTTVLDEYKRRNRYECVLHYTMAKNLKKITSGTPLIEFRDSSVNGWLRYRGLRGFLHTQHVRIKKEISRMSADI